MLQWCVYINRKNPGRSASDNINEDTSGNFEWSSLQSANKERQKMGTHMGTASGMRVHVSVAAKVQLIRAWAGMLLAECAWLVKYLRVLLVLVNPNGLCFESENESFIE